MGIHGNTITPSDDGGIYVDGPPSVDADWLSAECARTGKTIAEILGPGRHVIANGPVRL